MRRLLALRHQSAYAESTCDTFLKRHSLSADVRPLLSAPGCDLGAESSHVTADEVLKEFSQQNLWSNAERYSQLRYDHGV